MKDDRGEFTKELRILKPVSDVEADLDRMVGGLVEKFQIALAEESFTSKDGHAVCKFEVPARIELKVKASLRRWCKAQRYEEHMQCESWVGKNRLRVHVWPKLPNAPRKPLLDSGAWGGVTIISCIFACITECAAICCFAGGDTRAAIVFSLVAIPLLMLMGHALMKADH